MPIPADAEAFNRWRDEAEQTEHLLTCLEESERANLRALGCPTDPVGVFAVLNGERPAPWPKRTAARDRQRARSAMLVLALTQQARGHLSFGTENSHLAVYAAMLAVAHANNAAANAVLAEAERQGGRKGGLTTGEQVTQAATARQEQIRTLVGRWRASDELKLQYRSATSYVCEITGLADRTVQRHLKTLGLTGRARRSA